MEKKTYSQLREQRLAANEKLGDIYVKAANRELNDEEKMQVINLTREIEMCEREMTGINLDVTNQKANASREQASKKAAFREILKDAKDHAQKREVLLFPTDSNVNANITASGAIELSIKEMIPTLHEGLGLPVGLGIVTGVTGDELWPVSVNDVEMEEKGEVEALNDQVLEFEKIAPVQNRVGLKVPVSNMAIDNAAFDLMAFVQTKFEIALREYLAKKIYSQANWAKNKGPFSGMTPQNIELGADAYKNILAAVASFSDKGFYEGNVCISMDRVTEAELKATPKIAGAAGGFVIENGLCAGYPYTVSHFVNRTLNSAGKLVPTADRFIEIGYWEFFALQQHGDVRMVVDPITLAGNNVTRVILNTAWSMTDLSVYINGADNESQAFGLYKIVEEEPTTT
jgi:HK97 family phage major capsid protein